MLYHEVRYQNIMAEVKRNSRRYAVFAQTRLKKCVYSPAFLARPEGFARRQETIILSGLPSVGSFRSERKIQRREAPVPHLDTASLWWRNQIVSSIPHIA
jgi:hypothetical protein